MLSINDLNRTANLGEKTDRICKYGKTFTVSGLFRSSRPEGVVRRVDVAFGVWH